MFLIFNRVTAVLLALSFISGASAHSQSPGKIEKVTPWAVETVKIKLTNLNNFQQSYELWLDTAKLGNTPLIPANSSRSVNVRLQTETGQETNRNLCSVSVSEAESTIRTRVCTTVKLYRPEQ